MKNALICVLLFAALLVVPFLLRPRNEETNSFEKLVVISPHNDLLRREFERGFQKWMDEKFQQNVKIIWRNVGGASDIIRYLESEKMGNMPQTVDLFFGGGMYDHQKAEKLGLLTPANVKLELLDYPERVGGEIWRTKTTYGTALSCFGICYNPDRLNDLGIKNPPKCWEDLTDSRYFKTLGVADPTKSGSIAKAMEMIVHDQCLRAVKKAGFSIGEIERIESEKPFKPPQKYENAVNEGFINGLNILRKIGANARSFSDAAGSVPQDCANGVISAGLVIDFFAKMQEETTPNTIRYITPEGGSSISADPISLLKNAPNQELAEKFIEFVLSDGQSIFAFRKGMVNGPKTVNFQRFPIASKYYPPKLFEADKTAVDFSLPENNPYIIATQYPYVARWTGGSFDKIRFLFKALCIESHVELKAAAQRGKIPSDFPPDLMSPLPCSPLERFDLLQKWIEFFRNSYKKSN